MPKFTTDSKWLSHNDISDVEDTIVTIKAVEQETVGMGAQAQEKWVLYFREFKKGLALNKTNGKTIAKIMGTDEMDEWVGKKIALYVKDDVEYQGEIVSAIRVRVKLPTAKPASTNKSVTAHDLEEQVKVSQSVKEILGTMREIALADLSDEDRKALTILAEQRMESLAAN